MSVLALMTPVNTFNTGHVSAVALAMSCQLGTDICQLVVIIVVCVIVCVYSRLAETFESVLYLFMSLWILTMHFTA